jgi:hypothetical protein
VIEEGTRRPPDFAPAADDGSTVKPSERRGRPVVLDERAIKARNPVAARSAAPRSRTSPSRAAHSLVALVAVAHARLLTDVENAIRQELGARSG